MSFLSAPLPYKKAIVTSLFGTTAGRYLPHEGVDFGVPSGTPVLSIMDGKVTRAENHPALGGVVDVRHSNGLTTVYGHLSMCYVRVGQIVSVGQKIGLSGGGPSDSCAGRSMGPHLHFELRTAAGRAINPLPLLSTVLRMEK